MFKVGTPAETLVPFENEHQEGFLEGYKVLTPIDGEIPPAQDVLTASPTKHLIVGITGVSCGGKTTMAKAFLKWLGDLGVTICQDDYYYPAETLPINPITNFREFDEPESVNMGNIVRDIKQWKADKEAEEEQMRLEGRSEDEVLPSVLVVEGTMIFTCPEILELCDLRYMIHVDFKTAEYRRSLRNYPIPDPPGIVSDNIWPKYLKHRKVSRNIAARKSYVFKQIDGTHIVEQILCGIVADVSKSEHL